MGNEDINTAGARIMAKLSIRGFKRAIWPLSEQGVRSVSDVAHGYAMGLSFAGSHLTLALELNDISAEALELAVRMHSAGTADS